jgi:mannose-6-phosphate isomerase-like protein (cupin superfamily)
MKLISPLILLSAIITLAFAKMPTVELPNFAHWTAKELRGYEKPLEEKVSGPNKTSSVKLADYGSSNVSISHREAYGIPEIHDHMDDYFVVQSGAATLIIGGEVVHPKKQDDPRETRGDAIKGGEKRKLLPGDVVHIPHKMPHQLLVEPGKKFTYFVIKVKAE